MSPPGYNNIRLEYLKHSPLTPCPTTALKITWGESELENLAGKCFHLENDEDAVRRSNMIVIFILSGKCRSNSFLCIFPAADKGQSGSLLITSYSAPLTMIDSGLITQESHRGLWLCFLATREPFRKAFGCYVFLSKAKNHRLKGHSRDWLFEIIAHFWSLIQEANEHLALRMFRLSKAYSNRPLRKGHKGRKATCALQKAAAPSHASQNTATTTGAQCWVHTGTTKFFLSIPLVFFSFGGRWDAGISVSVVFVTKSVMVLLQKMT